MPEGETSTLQCSVGSGISPSVDELTCIGGSLSPSSFTLTRLTPFWKVTCVTNPSSLLTRVQRKQIPSQLEKPAASSIASLVCKRQVVLFVMGGLLPN